MSERVRRSSRLQDKRTKLIAKVRKKSCRIADDDSSSSDSLDPADGANDSVLTSSNTSFTRRKNQIGSRGGNFTRVYNSYCKESSLAADLDTYENDFIDDNDDSDGSNSNSTEEDDEVIIGENSLSDRSMEDENQLHTSFSRKRKRRLSGDSSSEESSNSDIVMKKKKRPAPMRSSSRAASLKEKKEANKMEKLQELKRTRDRKRAGLRIEALEEEQEEDESANEQMTTDSEEDAKFVVSDNEAADQPSDFEHSNDDLHLTLKPSMSTHLFSSDHISEVKEQLLKILKRRKSIDCDELLKVVEEGDVRKIDTFMEQLMSFYNNADLSSDVAHLVLQLTICYDHSTVVGPLILQYKIDPNRSDHRGIIPLTLAAAYGHYKCFKILLHHTKLQPILAKHPTLLHVTVEAALSNETNIDNSYHIMKLLFEERREFFNQMMSSKTHPTIIEMVIWYGRVMCLAYLLENCAEVFKGVVEITKSNTEEFPPSLIILAVCSPQAPHQQEIGNNLVLQLLLEHKISNIDMSDSKGWTGLMWSTYYKNTDCMKSLLDHNATVYCRDEHGTSCLHIAALLGATKCAQLLINHRHPIDCTDNKGWPPLLYANFSSERECVLTIMKAKPNQLLMLGNLLEKSYDVESEAKQRTYLQVQKVLEAVAQHEAYYALFNQFICDNPNILMEDGDSTFLQKCKDLLDFNNKKKWFYKMLDNLKKFATPSDYRSDYYGYTTLNDINRESVLLTAYRRLRYTSPSSLRMNFNVTFRNEPGVAAGPRREFWSCFSQDVVKKDHHLFKKCDNSHYTFIAYEILKHEKHHKCFINDNLEMLKFIGKMLAVAVNHKDIISFRLAHPILKMLLGMSLVHPDDMEATDGEYYQNFHSFDGDISDLGLSFSDLLCCPVCRKNESFDLPTNSSDQYDVTESNKAAFIEAVSVFKLEDSIKRETESFLKGFWEVIPVEYLRIFTPDQFSLLLSGIPTIDVDDWEQNTEYTYYGSNENSAHIIGWFWSLVRSLAEEEKALLLKFCTGSPRVPAGGFANLEGLSGLTKFRISFASGEDRVPEASTCFNNLRLSHYTNEQQCRDKILIAIRFGCEGFSFG